MSTILNPCRSQQVDTVLACLPTVQTLQTVHLNIEPRIINHKRKFYFNKLLHSHMMVGRESSALSGNNILQYPR